jgi:PE family
VIAAAGRQQPLRALCGSVHVREEERMSFVSTQPEALTAGAGTLHGIRSSMSAQSAAAAAPTTGAVPAAADQVSAQFATHAQIYQAVSAQAAAMHEMIVNTSATSAGSYAATEAANAIAAG